MPIEVEGFQQLQRALARADRDVRLGVRKELREAADPIAGDAERLALARIRNMPASPRWARMRVGVTQKLVYVAPRERGVKHGGSAARPNMRALMLDRAMLPAAAQGEPGLRHRMEMMLDHMADRFNRGR